MHHCATTESEQQASVKMSVPISEIYKECKNKKFKEIKAQWSMPQDKLKSSQFHPAQRRSICKWMCWFRNKVLETFWENRE